MGILDSFILLLEAKASIYIPVSLRLEFSEKNYTNNQQRLCKPNVTLTLEITTLN